MAGAFSIVEAFISTLITFTHCFLPMHQEFQKIEELLDYALRTPGLFGKGVHAIGKVDAALAQAIREAIQTDTLAFRITVDHSSILHVFWQHGDESTEALRGQLPIGNTDVLMLAQWLTRPDYVEDAGQNPGETRCLRFKWTHGNELTTVILNVRTGRRKQQLSLKTMYKKRLVT
jgi:hypothetical protein